MKTEPKLPFLSQDDKQQTFDYFWSLETAWYEPPNHRRGGWSGVIKSTLGTDAARQSVFIKRQKNHLCRTRKHCIRGIPTFQREYENIMLLERLNVPCLEAVYFAKRANKAILITKALDDFQGLDTVIRGKLSVAHRNELLQAVASVIEQMHAYKLQHSCLYPKHIFVRCNNNQWEVRLIDLEKLSRRFSKRKTMIHDLSSLNRHTNPSWSLADRMRFFKAYLGEKRLSPASKKLWNQISQKSEKKRR